jgi:hypothetical protein
LRRLLLLGVTVLALVMTGVATAGTGGNKTGQACYESTYVNYIDPATGQAFTSQDACVSYVAQGGTLSSYYHQHSASDCVAAGGTFTEPIWALWTCGPLLWDTTVSQILTADCNSDIPPFSFPWAGIPYRDGFYSCSIQTG